MRSPTLNELPPPPLEKNGWPWTEETPQIPGTMADGRPWPRVSIITPSYNQGQYIEETIRSVLLQGYPNLEYIIIDGGSTDNSVEVIRKYEPWLAYWVSEPDRGQTHAINKGFKVSNGDIVAWLNSDDTYMPDAIQSVVRHFLLNGSTIAYGNCNLIDETGKMLRVVIPPRVTFESLVYYWKTPESTPPQPGIFFRRKVLNEVGPLDERLRYVMDFDLWLRMAERYPFNYLDVILGNCRMHSESKTMTQIRYFHLERYQVTQRYTATRGIQYRLSRWTAYKVYELKVLRSRIWRFIKKYPCLHPLERLILRVVGTAG